MPEDGLLAGEDGHRSQEYTELYSKGIMLGNGGSTNPTYYYQVKCSPEIYLLRNARE